MPVRVIRRRGWKRLLSGACMLTGDPRDVALVTIRKSSEDTPMLEAILKLARAQVPELAGRYDRQEISDAMLALAQEQHPGVPPATALAKAWESRSPELTALYKLHALAPEPDPAPISRRDQPPSAWREIEKRGREIVEEAGGQLTVAEGIDEALRRDPGLYSRYCEQAYAALP
jgi:hypothetical protein